VRPLRASHYVRFMILSASETKAYASKSAVARLAATTRPQRRRRVIVYYVVYQQTGWAQHARNHMNVSISVSVCQSCMPCVWLQMVQVLKLEGCRMCIIGIRSLAQFMGRCAAAWMQIQRHLIAVHKVADGPFAQIRGRLVDLHRQRNGEQVGLLHE